MSADRIHELTAIVNRLRHAADATSAIPRQHLCSTLNDALDRSVADLYRAASTAEVELVKLKNEEAKTLAGIQAATARYDAILDRLFAPTPKPPVRRTGVQLPLRPPVSEKTMNDKIQALRGRLEQLRIEAAIISCGTGSAITSKYRDAGHSMHQAKVREIEAAEKELAQAKQIADNLAMMERMKAETDRILGLPAAFFGVDKAKPNSDAHTTMSMRQGSITTTSEHQITEDDLRKALQAIGIHDGGDGTVALDSEKATHFDYRRNRMVRRYRVTITETRK